ncbi:MAG: dienelactone hydrolase family protein [Aquihabitans sp.]
MLHLSDPNRRHRGRAALAAVLAAAALLAGACSSDGSDGATKTTAAAATVTTVDANATTTETTEPADEAESPPPAEIGTYPVGKRMLDLVDGSRTTKPHAGQPEQDSRALPVLVVYPAAGEAAPLDPADNPEVEEDADPGDGRFPLLLMSHGLGARNIAYETQMATWASAGYVVVAPDHPLANSDSVGGPTPVDIFNQPGDLSYVIDVFTDTAGDGESTGDEVPAELIELVDGSRIGAVGHSLGGATVVGLGFGDCCTDDRVDAVVSWAGLELLVQDVDPDAGDRPLLLVHGTKDRTVDYSQAEVISTAVDSPRWLITLVGAGHVTPFLTPHADAASAVVTYSALDFFDAWVKDDPTGMDRLETLVDEAGPDVATLEVEGP